MTITPSFPHTIDSSMLTSFTTCPQLFYNTYCLSLTSPYLSPDLHAGGSLSHAIYTARTAYHINNRTSSDSLALGLSALTTYYSTFNPLAPTATAPTKPHIKSYLNTCHAFATYFETYPLATDPLTPYLPISTLPSPYTTNPYTSPHLLPPTPPTPFELTFSLPLPILHPTTSIPLRFSGRIDMLATASTHPSATIIVDEKTTRTLTPTFFNSFALRSQFLGYAYSLTSLYPSLPPPTHALIRGIGFRTSTIEHAQHYLPLPQHLITRWYCNTLHLITRMTSLYTTLHRNRQALSSLHPNSPHLLATQNTNSHTYFPYAFSPACYQYGPCTFHASCSSANPPSLYTQYHRTSWNPLTGHSTSLTPLTTPHPPLPSHILSQLKALTS